jgi:hypothetical protein
VPLADITAQACPASVCVAAVLGDARHRVSMLGGREGMPRSLGSVYGGAVTRFLGGGVRDVARRIIATPGVRPGPGSMAVSRDGSTLLVSDSWGGSNALHVYSVADGSRLRLIGGAGDGPLQFAEPGQVWIAGDDFVFVADSGNNRVQVLTPNFDFHGFIGEPSVHYRDSYYIPEYTYQIENPEGVCANLDVVVVSEMKGRISVFNRCDGSRSHELRSWSHGHPHGPLCFMHGDRHVAVADRENTRVSVFSVDGDFVRSVGDKGARRRGDLHGPTGVACSAFDELVVADWGIVAFTGSGERLQSIPDLCGEDYSPPDTIDVAIHGGAIFVLCRDDDDETKCIIVE